MTRIADFLRGLISLAFTLALLGAVPFLLATRYGWPFDDAFDVLTDELASDSTIVETLLTTSLVSIAWAAWAMIAVAILTEAFAMIRGTSAPRLPVPHGLQRSAARLVASCALVLSSFAASSPTLASAPIAPFEAGSAAQNVLVVDDPTATYNETTVTDIVDDRPVYDVSQGDTWWSISERMLGDGIRWNDVREASVGKTMDDGTVINSATSTPRAGWRITLPADAVLPLETAAPEAAPAALQTTAPAAAQAPDLIRVGDTDEVVDVERGDNFWAISSDVLTEAWGRTPTSAEIHPFWQATVALNTDQLAPPGDPNMIYPNQTFQLPEIPANPDAAIGDSGTAVVYGTPSDVAVEAPPLDPPAPAETGDVVAEPAPEVVEQTPVVDEPVVETPVVDEPVLEEPAAEAPAPVEETPIAEDPVVDETPALEESVGDDAVLAPPVVPPIVAPRAADAPVQDATAAPAPMPVPSGPQVAAQPTPVEAPAAPPVAAAASVDNDTASDNGGLLLPAIIVSGIGLLAAGVLTVLKRLRNRKLGERTPGTAPKFRPPVGIEAELNRSTDHDALHDVDAAMRYLGTRLGSLDPIPTIVGVSVEDAQIIVLLDEPYPDAPAPFVAEGNVWTLQRPLKIETPAAGTIAPLPALVTVGHTSKSQLLLDLEHAGVINITGTRSDVESTMATMALELATSSLADQIRIVCVGFAHPLEVFERVTIVDDLSAVADMTRSHAEMVSGAAGADLSAVAGRVTDVAGDAWTPLVVFAPDTGLDDSLLDDARRTAAAGVTALVTADGSADWQLHAKNDQIHIPHIRVTVRRRNLSPQQLAEVSDLVTDARNPEMIEVEDLLESIHRNDQDRTPVNGTVVDDVDDPGGPQAVDLWDATEPFEPVAAVAEPIKPDWDVDYIVEVMGRVRVVDRDGNEVRFTRPAAVDFLVYLVLHRNGVSTDTTMEALWPNQEPNKPRLYNVTSNARTTLGSDDNDVPYVPDAADSIFRVSDRVGNDFDRLSDLVEHAKTCRPARAVAVLREGLELVRGRPFSGRDLEWDGLATRTTNAMLKIDEAARAMASLALDELDEPDEAVWATDRGLSVNPTSIELHLLRLRAALARNESGLEPEAVFQQYRTVVEADDALPEGQSWLDDRIVELYETHRLSNPNRWADTGNEALESSQRSA